MFSVASFATELPTVVWGVDSGLASLNPFQVSSLEAYQVTANVWEPLARRLPLSGELEPRLATKWTLNPEKKSFRVNLREDAVFGNGKPLTAEDVKFTFESYFNSKSQAEIWRPMFEGTKSVKVIDPHTVEFVLKKWTYLDFLNIMTALRILPKSFYASADKKTMREHMVGSGPFRLKKFNANQDIVLEPNPRWWGSPKPQFQLRVKTVRDAELATELLRKGQIDAYALHAGEIPRLSEADEKIFRVLKSDSAQGDGLWIDLNLRRKLFQNRRLREALLILWDRARLNRTVYGGEYQIARDTFAAKMKGYPGGQVIPYDPSKARRILKDLGWVDSNRDGILDQRIEGQRQSLHFTILVHSTAAERWVGLYQSDAAKVGVKVDLRRVEGYSQWWKALKEGKFDAVAGEGGVSESVAASTWRSDGFYNFSGFHDPDVDRKIDRLQSEFDPLKRASLERDLIKKIREDLPQIPGLYSSYEHELFSRRLDVDTSRPLDVWRWRIKN